MFSFADKRVGGPVGGGGGGATHTNCPKKGGVVKGQYQLCVGFVGDV